MTWYNPLVRKDHWVIRVTQARGPKRSYVCYNAEERDAIVEFLMMTKDNTLTFEVSKAHSWPIAVARRAHVRRESELPDWNHNERGGP